MQDPTADSGNLHIEFELVLRVAIAGSNTFVFGGRDSLQSAYEVANCTPLVPDEPCCNEPRLCVLLLDVDLKDMAHGCCICGPPHDLSWRHPESIPPNEGEVRKLGPGYRFVVVFVKKFAEVYGILDLGDRGEQRYEFSRASRRSLYQC